jgi:hypothetical protein
MFAEILVSRQPPLSVRRRGRQKRLLGGHQIGQREHAQELGRVLLEAAVAHFAVMKAILDDVGGMLDPGPHPRFGLLFGRYQTAQPWRQRFDNLALDRDIPGQRAVRQFRSFRRPGIVGIGKNRLLLAVQQRRRLVDVGLIGGDLGERVHQPEAVCTRDEPSARNTPDCPSSGAFRDRAPSPCSWSRTERK